MDNVRTFISIYCSQKIVIIYECLRSSLFMDMQALGGRGEGSSSCNNDISRHLYAAVAVVLLTGPFHRRVFICFMLFFASPSTVVILPSQKL